MSFFNKLLGIKPTDDGPTPAQAIQKLRETEDMLIKKQEFLEKKVDAELATAKKFGTKNKRAALQALKRKNRYMKQLQQIDGTLSTIEMQREALEGANTNTAVLQTMKGAADALKKAHKHMDVDQVHDMMDDIAEQQGLAKEISEAISDPVAFGNDIDEDDLERELEELEQQELDGELLNIGPSPKELPAVPSAILDEPSKAKAPAKSRARNKEDDDDMKELEMWAS